MQPSTSAGSAGSAGSVMLALRLLICSGRCSQA